MPSIAIRIRELDDEQLEEFIELWIERRNAKYFRVERMGAANDKGRDVVGFYTRQSHEGPWDLFQCKRKTRDSKLGLPEAIVELGKVIHHHVEGAYKTLPSEYIFVAPRGVVGPLKDLILNPSTIAPRLIADWDKYCARGITSKGTTPLSPAILAAIGSYDFSRVSYLAAERIAKEQAAQPALSKVLDLLPGEAPPGAAPHTLQPSEAVYVGQLRQVYEEASGLNFRNADEVFAHPKHGAHLAHQRTRFFEASAFSAFHRDNTEPDALRIFVGDVHDGVFEVHGEPHPSLLARVDAVMKHVGLAPIPVKGRATRGPVRQGMCHQLVNDGKLKWTR